MVALVSGVFSVEHEQREAAVDGSCLTGILQIQRKVEAFAQEDDSCGVAIDTVDAYGTIACNVSEKVDVLVGVCQCAAGLSGKGHGRQQRQASHFCYFHLNCL